jgi:hypothetical protein
VVWIVGVEPHQRKQYELLRVKEMIVPGQNWQGGHCLLHWQRDQMQWGEVDQT